MSGLSAIVNSIVRIPSTLFFTSLRHVSTSDVCGGRSKGREPPKREGPIEVNDKLQFVIQNRTQPNSQRTSRFGLAILTQRDCERRVVFADQMLSILQKDPTILRSIVFSDEGNFWPVPVKGSAPTKSKKRHNESDILPTIVWCGMSTREVIGPYFFNSYVTESSYLKMLRKYMLPQLTCLNYPIDTTWFQQDGAPPHRTGRVLSFLQGAFEDRLISYGCPIAWPPRSQDLTPLDYFLWDYLKDKIAPFEPKSSQEIRECIAFEMKVVDPGLLNKAVLEFSTRLEKCLKANGQRFSMD